VERSAKASNRFESLSLMPIYEYDCQSCKKRTEAIQRVGERPLKICPHCGGKLKKAFSAPAIQFKGSGWYVTDYAGARGEQKSKEAAADSKEGSEKAEKAEKAEKTENADKSVKTEMSEKVKKDKPKSSKSKASS
jgi:putative FmdB family regulatory protein